jgi:hypothetical protein
VRVARTQGVKEAPWIARSDAASRWRYCTFLAPHMGPTCRTGACVPSASPVTYRTRVCLIGFVPQYCADDPALGRLVDFLDEAEGGG